MLSPTNDMGATASWDMAGGIAKILKCDRNEVGFVTGYNMVIISAKSPLTLTPDEKAAIKVLVSTHSYYNLVRFL